MENRAMRIEIVLSFCHCTLVKVGSKGSFVKLLICIYVKGSVKILRYVNIFGDIRRIVLLLNRLFDRRYGKCFNDKLRWIFYFKSYYQFLCAGYSEMVMTGTYLFLVSADLKDLY